MSNLIIISDSEEDEDTQELIISSFPYCALLIEKMPLDIRTNHRLAVQYSIAHPNEPILFLVSSVNTSENNQYAWYPPGDIDLSALLLDTLYVTLREPAQLDQHCILVQCFIGLLLVTSKMDLAKEAAKQLLTECFGTHQLGRIKRVIRPADCCDKAIGEIDFYLLPQRLQCYSLLRK